MQEGVARETRGEFLEEREKRRGRREKKSMRSIGGFLSFSLSSFSNFSRVNAQSLAAPRVSLPARGPARGERERARRRQRERERARREQPWRRRWFAVQSLSLSLFLALSFACSFLFLSFSLGKQQRSAQTALGGARKRRKANRTEETRDRKRGAPVFFFCFLALDFFFFCALLGEKMTRGQKTQEKKQRPRFARRGGEKRKEKSPCFRFGVELGPFLGLLRPVCRPQRLSAKSL